MAGIFTPKGQTNPFSLPVSRSSKVDPEELIHWWNPNRLGVEKAPSWFRKKLDEIDPQVQITYSPVHSRWLVWVPNGRVTHQLCPGWMLLFVHQDANGSRLPLDERLFARLYSCSIAKQNISAKQYFERIETEMARDQALKEKSWQNETIDRAMPSFDHSQIKISMYGPSNGSKFSDYLS